MSVADTERVAEGREVFVRGERLWKEGGWEESTDGNDETVDGMDEREEVVEKNEIGMKAGHGHRRGGGSFTANHRFHKGN